MTTVVPWRAALAVAYMAGIVFLSSRSASELRELGLPLQLDGFGHVVLFGGLASVTMWSLVGPRPRRVLTAVLVCSLFALSDEWHQLFVPGRVTSLGDLLADALGIFIGVAAVAAIPQGQRTLATRTRLPKGGVEQ